MSYYNDIHEHGDEYMLIDQFERGELDGDEIVSLFQKLVDTGLIHDMSSDYMRKAQNMFEQGLISLGKGH